MSFIYQPWHILLVVCMFWTGMLTQGDQGGRRAPLASRLHRIPTHFRLNLHGI